MKLLWFSPIFESTKISLKLKLVCPSVFLSFWHILNFTKIVMINANNRSLTSASLSIHPSVCLSVHLSVCRQKSVRWSSPTLFYVTPFKPAWIVPYDMTYCMRYFYGPYFENYQNYAPFYAPSIRFYISHLAINCPADSFVPKCCSFGFLSLHQSLCPRFTSLRFTTKLTCFI